MRRLGIGLVGVAACTAAHAQEDSATWLWEVTTQDGDATVEPGETATITISLFMDVDVGKGEEIALHAATFNTLGGKGAAKGGIQGWEILNDLYSLTGDLTTTDGVSLFGTNVGQCLPPQYVPCDLDNPIDVLAFEWSTDDYAEYDVHYATDTQVVVVVKDVFGSGEEFVQVDAIEASIVFDVIPTPSGVLVLVLAPVAIVRRRR